MFPSDVGNLTVVSAIEVRITRFEPVDSNVSAMGNNAVIKANLLPFHSALMAFVRKGKLVGKET